MLHPGTFIKAVVLIRWHTSQCTFRLYVAPLLGEIPHHTLIHSSFLLPHPSRRKSNCRQRKFMTEVDHNGWIWNDANEDGQLDVRWWLCCRNGFWSSHWPRRALTQPTLSSSITDKSLWRFRSMNMASIFLNVSGNQHPSHTPIGHKTAFIKQRLKRAHSFPVANRVVHSASVSTSHISDNNYGFWSRV